MNNIRKSFKLTPTDKDKRIEELEKENTELEQQIEKMKSDVISERDKAKRLEDVITYTVLNNILAKWEIKENDITRSIR